MKRQFEEHAESAEDQRPRVRLSAPRTSFACLFRPQARRRGDRPWGRLGTDGPTTGVKGKGRRSFHHAPVYLRTALSRGRSAATDRPRSAVRSWRRVERVTKPVVIPKTIHVRILFGQPPVLRVKGNCLL